MRVNTIQRARVWCTHICLPAHTCRNRHGVPRWPRSRGQTALSRPVGTVSSSVSCVCVRECVRAEVLEHRQSSHSKEQLDWGPVSPKGRTR